jgi:serine protease Do
VVTIGYLIMEAATVVVTDIEGNELPARIVGYDYESGFGLVRTEQPIRRKPMRFGDSDSLVLRSEAYVAGLGGAKDIGNICSTTRSSPCRPIRCGAVRR